MSLAVLLLDLPEVLVEQVIIGAAAITLVARLIPPAMPCPCCAQPATRVHSRSRRLLSDLPAGGRQVRLSLQIRRFFCQNPTCPRRTFTEQLPRLAAPHAQKTVRLKQALCQIGFALGGEAGARLVRDLGMPCSPDTLLRLVRQQPLPKRPTPRVLSVDDWAFRRRNLFGTILVDLERHCPVDLLPDREAATLAAWLEAHPGVEIVSRDRSQTYAEGIRLGAPQALQVADRYHLVANLREAMQAFLNHRRACLPTREEEATGPPSSKVAPVTTTTVLTHAALLDPLPTEPPRLPEQQDALTAFTRDRRREHWFHVPSEAVLAHSQLSRAKRLKRYEEIRALAERGLSLRTIALTLGISRKTAQRFAHAETFPEQGSRPRRTQKPSLLAPFVPALLERWQAGEFNGSQLYREVCEQGYTGSRSLVALFIADLRRMHPPMPGTPRAWLRKAPPRPPPPLTDAPRAPPPKSRRLSPRAASWLFVLPPDRLTERQQAQVAQLRQAGGDLEDAYVLSQEFVQMLHEQQASGLESWLQGAEASGIPALKGFAKGIRRDYEAVVAAFSLEWSQGPTEGHVNKLKNVKRSMFGRATFALLRQRVLQDGCA